MSDEAPGPTLIQRVKQLLPDRNLRGPVGWMLDRQLVLSLREIFLYSAFGTKFDARNWMVGRERDFALEMGSEEFWFDYLSDSGDGMRATYSIAYLAQSDLFVTQQAKAGEEIAFDETPDRPRRIPRGAFLFVGGDTAYHVADFETLTERFQTPFNFAFRDLDAEGKLAAPARRPIFGIPGNHDYYDFLDGFNRQFRRPYDPEPRFDTRDEGDKPQLVLEGFERKQWASYVSLELPFGWRMFGLDAQNGTMDRRQKHYFRSILEDPKKATDKLIVATPEPIVSFGRQVTPESEYAKTFKDLGLPRPFLDPPEPLPAGHCRLDLAGDVHHYARYWGANPGEATDASYSSVVSGLGGAFLHPSSTDVGEVPSKARYPLPRVSLAKVLERILKPWMIIRGGRLWLIGILITGLIYSGAASSESLRSVLQPIFEHVGLSLPSLPPDPEVTTSYDPIVHALGGLRSTLYGERFIPPDPAVGKPAPLVGSGLWHRELAYLPVLFAVLLWGSWLNVRLDQRAKKEDIRFNYAAYRWPIRALFLTAAASVFWVYIYPGYGEYGNFHPLASSFIMLALLAASFLGLLWSRAYDEAMNTKARVRGRLTLADQVHGWLLWIFTLLAWIFGLARYGVDAVSVMAADSGYLIVVLGTLIGLPLFAWSVGGALKGILGKAGFFLLGIWQAFLQLALPLLLVIACPPWVALLAGVATVGFSWLAAWIAPHLLRRDDAGERGSVGWILFAAWLFWDGLLLALIFSHPTPQKADWASCLVALALGVVLCCAWFGWYLAVSICFDGHNNEAGGGARIEQFKQFIRFRLTKEGLTGYVIAIDDPQEDGRLLKPRLIDVFEVRPG